MAKQSNGKSRSNPVKHATFLGSNDNDVQIWRGKVETGKGTAKRESHCNFVQYPTFDVAATVLGYDGAMLLLNRQAKTDCYNDHRNGMNAVATPLGTAKAILADLAAGKISSADAMAAMAELVGTVGPSEGATDAGGTDAGGTDEDGDEGDEDGDEDGTDEDGIEA